MLTVNIEKQYSLVDKQSSLSIACVAEIEATARLDNLIIEIICHLWFWITVDEPHQIHIMVLCAIGVVMLTAQKAEFK